MCVDYMYGDDSTLAGALIKWRVISKRNIETFNQPQSTPITKSQNDKTFKTLCYKVTEVDIIHKF